MDIEKSYHSVVCGSLYRVYVLVRVPYLCPHLGKTRSHVGNYEYIRNILVYALAHLRFILCDCDCVYSPCKTIHFAACSYACLTTEEFIVYSHYIIVFILQPHFYLEAPYHIPPTPSSKSSIMSLKHGTSLLPFPD